MKKLVLTTVCALAVTGAAFAQGTLYWSGFNAAFIAQTNSSTSPLFGGTGVGGTAGYGAINNAYYYELLYTTYSGTQAAVPASLASLAAWSDTSLQAVNGPGQNGRIVGNPANTGATVPWDTGTTQSVILVGWSANLGTSWATVKNELANWTIVYPTIVGPAFFGESVTGYINPLASGTSPGAVVFGPTAVGSGLPINNPSGSPAQLYLLPVPEPASLAIAGLGGLSLLLFRRQRK